MRSGKAEADAGRAPRTARLDRVLRAWDHLRADYSLPVLVLYSDFQRSTTGCLDTLLQRVTGPGRPPVICVSLAPRDPWNYSIAAARLHGEGSSAKVRVTVKACGRRLDSGEVSVSIGGIRAGRKRVSAAAGDSAMVDLDAPATAMGAGVGSVSLEAGDPLLFDNTAYFLARESATAHILIVGRPEKNYPLAAAFQAAGNGGGAVVSKDGDEVTYDDLDSAGIIVINALKKPSRSLDALLRGNASGGKVVVLGIGDSGEEFGNSVSLIADLLGTTGRLTPSVAPDSLPETVVLPDTLSDIWRGFPKMRTTEASVYRYVEGLPGTVLLRLSSGVPLVTALKDKAGRFWVLAGTPLGVSEANNLCETGFFVPALDRLVRYAEESGGLPTAAAWIAGVERRNPFYGSGKGATILDKEGKFLERWQAQPLVLFKEPGVYSIVPDKEAASRIIARPDPCESELVYGPPSLPGPSKDNVIVLNERELLDVVHHRGGLLAYLPWLLLALFLFAEIFLWEKGASNSNSLIQIL